MWFVHQSEDDLRVVFKSTGELTPEFPKLSCRGGFWIRRVPNDASAVWLRRWVIVAHVIVWIEDGVGPFSDCNVVYCVGVEIKMLWHVFQKSDLGFRGTS